MSDPLKVCSKCSESKPPTEFHSGYNYCKPCRSIQSKKWRAANQPLIRALRAAWNESNKPRRRAYYLAHKDHILAQAREYRRLHPERAKLNEVQLAKMRRDKGKLRGELRPAYLRLLIVKSFPGLRSSPIPPDFMEAKRLHVQLQRMTKAQNEN